MPVDEIAFEAEERMEKAVLVLEEKFRGLRAGRATPGLVENIRVDYYGSPTPLKQLANISAPEPQMLIIKAFDPGSLKDIEKAILQSDIGIAPNNDGKFIRLVIPPLSEERRQKIAVQARNMSEEAKVAIRNIRRDANKQIDKEQKDSEITEDDAHSGKDEIQDLTKNYEKQVDDQLKSKTDELMEV